jgi:TPR repeat protein
MSVPTRMAAACVCASLALTACTSTLDRGVDAYDDGQFTMAAQYWTPLARDGDRFAQNNLGVLYERGFGGERQDYDTAAYWYRASARQGYVPAMVQLARVLTVSGDEAEAERWLNEAVRWGDPEAIAMLRRSGRPVPPPDLLAEHERLEALADR